MLEVGNGILQMFQKAVRTSLFDLEPDPCLTRNVVVGSGFMYRRKPSAFCFMNWLILEPSSQAYSMATSSSPTEFNTFARIWQSSFFRSNRETYYMIYYIRVKDLVQKAHNCKNCRRTCGNNMWHNTQYTVTPICTS